MNDRDHALDLLRKAKDDLKALAAMARSRNEAGEFDFTDEIFGFHAQQAVEKTLKALLAFRSIRYPRSHDLQVLLDLLDGAGEDTAGMDVFVDLNPYAVQFRYESIDDEDEPLDRRDIVSSVEELIRSIEGRITAG